MTGSHLMAVHGHMTNMEFNLTLHISAFLCQRNLGIILNYLKIVISDLFKRGKCSIPVKTGMWHNL